MTPRALLLTTALATGLAAPAAAQTLTLRELFDIDRLATIGGQMAISALRGVAEVTYAHIDIRPMSGRMVLTGMEIAPYDDPDCRVSVDRVVMRTAPLDQIAYGALDIDLMGLEMAPGCLSARDREDLAEFGIVDYVLDRGEIRIEYDYASAGMDLTFQAVSGPLAEIRGAVRFAYFAMDFEAEEPVAVLSHAEIELADRGAWSAVSAQIPPAMLSAEALAAMLSAEFIPAPAAPPAPEAPPSDGKGPEAPEPAPAPAPAIPPDRLAVQAFIDESAASFARFAADPGLLRLELAPDAPVRLEEDHFEDIGRFVTELRPALRTGSETLPERITPAEAAVISDFLNGEAVLDSDDLLRFARAFQTGIGAPRRPEIAATLIRPMAQLGEPEAVEILLDLIDAVDPVVAYSVARDAAAAGNRAAFAQLDRLEARLSVLEVLDIQEADSFGIRIVYEGDARAVREAAFAALTGLGTPRRYSAAYFFALTALAMGDSGAASILDELEARGADMTDEEAERWTLLLDDVVGEVTGFWFASDEEDAGGDGDAPEAPAQEPAPEAPAEAEAEPEGQSPTEETPESGQ